jgi:hypothetical protein
LAKQQSEKEKKICANEALNYNGPWVDEKGVQDVHQNRRNAMLNLVGTKMPYNLRSKTLAGIKFAVN